MLRIKDEDLNLTCVEEGKYKGVNTLIITGTYSPKLTACKYFQSHANDADEKKTIVKNGKKEVTIRLESYQNIPTILKLKNNDIFVKTAINIGQLNVLSLKKIVLLVDS